MRIPINPKQNIWFNGRDVDDDDLNLEQNFNNQIEAGIVQNHFGTGILPDALVRRILFDTSNTSGVLDGKVLFTQNQPSDSNLGNQLEVELLHSRAAGRRNVKVLVVGLDFQNNLQYDRFIFNRNEKQISSKHYRSILAILFNDLIGTNVQSFNLGGQVIIREASPMSLSRDPQMIAQDVEPNLFFRDFFVVGSFSLATALATALPSYNIDTLGIKTDPRQLRSIAENDVSSQIGEKFLATTNNIQKITLLLSVINNTTPSNLNWTGDLIITVSQLQSSVNCPTDIVPQLAIDFDPSNLPLAQLSVSFDTLKTAGIVLNTVPQPVDFIFSNTSIASGLVIIPGNYYLVAVKRAGSADTCQIQLAVGGNTSLNTRETLFNGNVWTDVPEEALWFQVWTDAAKVSDGQAYDQGHGVVIPKTAIDPLTNSTADFSLDKVSFSRNDVFSAILQADLQESVLIPDERTGNNVFSEKQFVPNIDLANATALATLQAASDPLVLGTITDQNLKTFSASNATLFAAMHSFGLIKNQFVFKIIDPSDSARFDQNIVELVSEVVNNTLTGAKFTPDTSNPNLFYRIAKSELLTMKYGDVDGNGVIDLNDLLALNNILGLNLNVSPTTAQYTTETTPFVNDNSLAWTVMNGSTVVASGLDGQLTANPNDGSQSNFQSLIANFNSIANLGSLQLVISGSANAGNNGSFSIINLIDNADITIKKLLLTSDSILQAFRTDISGDMIIDSSDVNLITNYIEAVSPFPATLPPANKIGKTFTAIRFTLEEYVDRFDDYPESSSTRNASVHPVPDIFLDGYTLLSSDNLLTNPITFSITKQLTWLDSSIVVNSRARLVSAAFGYPNSPPIADCQPAATLSQVFPLNPKFSPGRNDFFIPNNLVINDGGQLLNNDGYFFKVDLEVGTVLLEMPEVNFDTEKTINLLTDFVADFTGDGFTRLGYPAMKFSDCTTVQLDALLKDQVRFNVSVQSFSPQLNGLDPTCISGIIVDGKIGVNIDYGSGILTLNFTNLYQDPVKQTLNTKIQVVVMLKKAGWNNLPIFVDSGKMKNVLGVPDGYVSPVDCPAPTMTIVP